MRRLASFGARRCGWLVVLAAWAACDKLPDAPRLTDAGADTAADTTQDVSDGAADLDDDTTPDPLRYLNRLASPQELARLQGAGGDVKFLFRVAGAEPMPPILEDCYFQNMQQYVWHIAFLNSFPELADLGFHAYTDLVLRDATRIWWGGGVQLWPSARHPLSNQAGIMSYVVYTDSAAGGTLTLPQVVEVDALAKSCAPFAASLLAWVPTDPYQQASARALTADLAAVGVAVVFPEQLIAGLESVVYSEGEGYGTLNLVAPGQVLRDYGPRDVVVVQSAPNDISVVAGLVTMEPQNPASHVNLRLQEKGIPNAAVPAIYDNAVVRALDGSLVRLQVTGTRVVFEPATLEAATAFWEAHRPTVPEPQADLTETALADYTTLSAADASAYGAKAANLAELHALLEAPHRVAGFGIPFARYVEHLERHGLTDEVERLATDPGARTDVARKRLLLDDLVDKIEDSPLDPGFEQALHAQLRAVYGEGVDTTFIRFRSSTNVEDLDALTGAGLYDSKSGCLADDLDGDSVGPSRCLDAEYRDWLETRLAAKQVEYAEHPERSWLPAIIGDLQGDLSKEKPVARAVRKVWSSLWNERAFDEREYYGIDQRDAYMGIAVNPTFALERLNAVAFTNLAGADGASVYRLVSQDGSESVVRPDDPTVVAEVLTFRRQGDAMSDVNLLIESSLSPGGSLWSGADLETLAGLLFTVQDHFATAVYPQLRPLRLDLEIKLDRAGEVVLKQVRPYVTAGP